MASKFKVGDKVKISAYSGMGTRWCDGTILEVFEKNFKYSYKVEYQGIHRTPSITLVNEDKRILLTPEELTEKKAIQHARTHSKEIAKGEARVNANEFFRNNLTKKIFDRVTPYIDSDYFDGENTDIIKQAILSALDGIYAPRWS